MKHCTKCGELKHMDEFYKRKESKDGRRSDCKLCMKSKNKDYYAANKEEIVEKSRTYREANKEKISKRRKDSSKSYYEANKEKILARSRDHYKNNRDKILARQKVYYEANKGKVDEYRRKYRNKMYEEDPMFRTMKLLRSQTSRLGEYKKTSTIELVGCSPESFWVMNGSPEDVNELHVDHIVPLSWFDLSNEDHLKVCSHWSNLQYLCAEDNLSKGDLYAGSPGNILGYKNEFDVDKFINERIELISR